MDRLLVLQVAQCWIRSSCQQAPHNGLLGRPRGQGGRHVEGSVPMGLETVRGGLLRTQTQLAWALDLTLYTTMFMSHMFPLMSQSPAPHHIPHSPLSVPTTCPQSRSTSYTSSPPQPQPQDPQHPAACLCHTSPNLTFQRRPLPSC